MRLTNKYFALAVLLCAPACAQDPGTPVRELAPGVFFWQGDHLRRVPANCVWINFKDYVLVIDANFPEAAKQIQSEIRKTTNKPIRFLFDTHYHGDHTQGNRLYTESGVTVVSSEPCAEEMRTKGQKVRVPIVPPTVGFSDRMIFDDGAQRVELILLGPAHSKGDAVAYLPKQKILVAGDLCVNWIYGNNVADVDADYDRWLRVLDDLAGWEIKTVVPGHGSLCSTETLRAQRAYLADMLAQVRAGLRAGKTADELAAKIDLSKHGSFAASAQLNDISIRAMCRKLGAGIR